jgi:hypothetical protein
LTRREHVAAHAAQNDVERLTFRHAVKIQRQRSARYGVAVNDLGAPTL